MFCVIGGGHLGSALIERWHERGVDVRVVERNAERRSHWATMGVLVDQVPQGADVVIAVKPADVDAAVGLAAVARSASVTSVAAGIGLDRIRASADGVPVLRAMPNLAARMGASVTAVVAPEVDPNTIDRVCAGLQHFGPVVNVDEADIDTVTAVSGSGLAYVFAFVEGLEAAAIQQGLDAEVARPLAEQTLRGAAALLEGRQSATRWRERVTTPNGTTAAGLEALSQAGFAASIEAAVRAARARSQALGS